MTLLWIPVWWCSPFTQIEWKLYLAKSCFPCLGYCFSFFIIASLLCILIYAYGMNFLIEIDSFLIQYILTSVSPTFTLHSYHSSLLSSSSSDLFFQLCFFFRIGQASKRAQANKNKQDTKCQGNRPHIDTEQSNHIVGKESQKQVRQSEL